MTNELVSDKHVRIDFRMRASKRRQREAAQVEASMDPTCSSCCPTAAGVTCSSCAVSLKLRCRAAASNARSALSGGRVEVIARQFDIERLRACNRFSCAEPQQ